jgi:hypothetical protein
MDGRLESWRLASGKITDEAYRWWTEFRDLGLGGNQLRLAYGSGSLLLIQCAKAQLEATKEISVRTFYVIINKTGAPVFNNIFIWNVLNLKIGFDTIFFDLHECSVL